MRGPLDLLLNGDPIGFFALIVAIIIALTGHEFAHAYAAYKLGDATPGDQNRLSLNPLKHIDPIGALMLLVVGFGWGRPVQFNPYNLKDQKWGPAIISIAGPAANLIMAIVFGLILKFAGNIVPVALAMLLTYLFSINIILMVFNLIPIPPLDGSKILYAFVPSVTEETKAKLEQYGPFLLLGLIFLGGGVLGLLFSGALSAAAKLLGL